MMLGGGFFDAVFCFRLILVEISLLWLRYVFSWERVGTWVLACYGSVTR